jgi:hypothetical protein
VTVKQLSDSNEGSKLDWGIYPSINTNRRFRLVFREPLLICTAQEQAALPYGSKAEHQELDVEWPVLIRGRFHWHCNESNM